MNFLAEIRNRFAAALQPLVEGPLDQYLDMVRPAQDAKFGDFQANCAMPLAKRTGGNPRELAANIAERLDVVDLCDDPEVAGPGFINLRLLDDRLQAATNSLLNDERLGVVPAASPRTVVIDYSAPNVAKPMHVGHLRSTVIGDALCRMLRFLGHTVYGDNHIGDWGTQFGMIIYGYKHFRDDAGYQSEPVVELARLYRLVNQLEGYHAARSKVANLTQLIAEAESRHAEQESAADPSDKKAKKALKKQRNDLDALRAELAAANERIVAVEADPSLKSLADDHLDIAESARRETAKLHAGDAENRALWDEFLPHCLAALDRVYDRLGVSFDMTLGESHYQPLLVDVVADLEARGTAAESDGAMCVFVEGNDAPFIVRKSDGAFTYATTDLATIRHRVEELHADTCLYVVDARQSEHFKLLFEVARRWGYKSVELRHIGFGTILDPKSRKPYKTRAGDTVGLESLLDEAVSRARAIVDENDDGKPDGPELDDAERQRVAKAVGLGGIKYADLMHNRESDYAFSWDKMLAKTGDTATYMQYSYARIQGIFRKGGVDPATLIADGATIRLTHAAERALGLALNRFPAELAAAASECRPNILTQYLFETANAFSTFYENCPVLKEENDAVRRSRLLLCQLTGRTLKLGLELLGIETCQRM